MSPEFQSLSAPERLQAAQRIVFDAIMKGVPPQTETDAILEKKQPGPVMRYIRDIYESRNQDTLERAELSQMIRAAQVIMASHEKTPTKDCQEFFCGELLGAEVIAQLIGTRKNTGKLAQDALNECLIIDAPEDPFESVKDYWIRQASIVERLQNYLSNNDIDLLPPEYEELLTQLILEKEKRYTDDPKNEVTPELLTSYPKAFAMGYRLIVNQAIHMGLIDAANNTFDTDGSDIHFIEPQNQADYESYQVAEEEVDLEKMLFDTFDPPEVASLEQVKSEILSKYHIIMSRFRAQASAPEIYTDESVADKQRRVRAVLEVYVRTKNLIPLGTTLSSRGNQCVLGKKEESEEETRFFFNSYNEIQGQYVGIDIIRMPNNKHLQHILTSETEVETNEEDYSYFVPALRFRDAYIISRDENERIISATDFSEEGMELSVPLIYTGVDLVRFIRPDEIN